ncbi:hypothetical protein Airi02_056630 [Actinoallomurus iriomotensis]|uniref:Uncharacterized protein n=2 Tax=Actinoallomurus iriomotensis TaxID=478107 RepID=A0A9W6S623_9ACTN|nr:hypothetical protein Airi02_056630 [Actinoallomurus iriomotensis]
MPGQPPDRRDAVRKTGQGIVKAKDLGGEQELSERFTVAGKPLREYLDPVGAAAWSNEVGNESPDPSDRAGDRIANPENEKQSRVEKLRRKFHREGTDAAETAGKAASRVKDVLSRSPVGHGEVRTGPSLSPAPHDGISVGDAATALIATGVVFGEFGRLIHEKLAERKRSNDGRDG